MANIQLLPGYGAMYTSESIVGAASGTAGADVIDTSRCEQFAVQVEAVTTPGSSTLQVQQTFDGTHWADLGSAMVIAAGNIIRFSSTGGPYGKIRLKVIDAAAAVHVTFVIVGFNVRIIT